MLKCKIKPEFKETNKSMWKTSNGFKVKQAKNVWKIQQYRDAEGKAPFIESQATMGQSLMARKRSIEREVSPIKFDSTIRSDNWRNDYSKVNSLNSAKGLQVQMKLMKLGEPV